MLAPAASFPSPPRLPATATGTFSSVVERALDRRGALPALAAATAALSAVVPNTPLIAMFAPRVVRWSQRTGGDASRFLLRLSFASILGGVVTLIGTSTNLVVSDLLEQSGGKPFGVLEITVVGLPIAVVGIVLLSTVGARLLPQRTAVANNLSRRAREFQMATRVDPDGRFSDFARVGAPLTLATIITSAAIIPIAFG
jgi:di/tricarboxylate transporter